MEVQMEGDARWPMVIEGDDECDAGVEQDVEWTDGAVVSEDCVTLPNVLGSPLRVHFRPSSTLSRTGACIWSGSLLLAEWILAHQDEVRAYEQIVELGCGVGLVWMVLQRVGAVHVVPTDARDAIASNACPVRVLDWTQPDALPSELRLDRRTLIVAADVVYDVALTAALAATLRSLFARLRPKPTALVAMERRVVWLFGDTRPSSVAHDEWLRQLQGAVAGPLCVEAIPRALPYERPSTMQLWHVAHM